MILEHLGKRPSIHETAWVAPDATVCGDVSIGAGARVMHGARIVAEGGRIAIGRCGIVMENAVVRATAAHDCRIGDHVLIGPVAHVVGARIDDKVFLATGAAIFHNCHIGKRAVVRIHGTVHVNTVLAPDSTVPIGWVAVGDPAQLFPPDRHDDLWAVQQTLNFTKTAYGIDPPLADGMAEITETVSARLAVHAEDKVVGS